MGHSFQMMVSPVSRSRFFGAAWLIALLFVAAACTNRQLSRLPPWMQDKAEKRTPPPAPPQPQGGTRTTQFPLPPARQAPATRPPPPTSPSSSLQLPPVPRPVTGPPAAGFPAAGPRDPGYARRFPAPPPPTVPKVKETALASKPLAEERFSQPSPPPIDPSVPRVALLLPFTGAEAKLGQAMLNAAQQALFDFADKKFELLPQDTRGTPEGAADAAALAIGDGAQLILGPLLASSVDAVAPAAKAAGINVIAFSNDRTIAGDGVFTMGFLPGEEVRRVVTYAAGKGIRRMAALAPDNDYGRTVLASLEQSAAASGVQITEMEFYPPGTKNFSAIVRRLADYDRRRGALLAQRKALAQRDDDIAKQALARLQNLQTIGDVPFQALLIADGGKRLQAIAAWLPHYDIDPKKIRMLGTGRWDVAGLGAEPAMVGGWYAAPAPEERARFVRQYKGIYGQKPHRLATLAYDAMALAAVLAKSGHRFDTAQITAPQGFSGRDGIFRFLPEGITQRGLAVLQVFERDTRTISRAPEGFARRPN